MKKEHKVVLIVAASIVAVYGLGVAYAAWQNSKAPATNTPGNIWLSWFGTGSAPTAVAAPAKTA